MIRYVGWVYGNEEDVLILKELGVEGSMIWTQEYNMPFNKKNGIIEHCVCTKEIFDSLKQYYPDFKPGLFTRMDDKEYLTYLKRLPA